MQFGFVGMMMKLKFSECVEYMIKGPFGSDMKKSLYVPKGEDTYKVYIQGNAIQKDENLGDYYVSSEYFHQKLERFQVHPGDYIITCDGTLGKYIKLSDDIEPGVISSSLLLLKLDETKIYDKYFELLWENSMLKYLASQARNACLVHLPSAKAIGDVEIILPELSIQREIADKAFLVKNIIMNRNAELVLFDELIKARFVELFGSLNNNEKGLDIVSIDELCTLIKDGTHQTPTYTEDKQNGYKFLSSKDVMTQKICWNDIKYIPAELHEKLYATIQPARNDILMSKNGVNYGVAAVNDTDEVFDIYVSLALLRPRIDRVNPVYLRCAINNPDTKHQFDSSIKGIGVPNLHLGEIKKTKVLLPPMGRQNEFVAFVKQTDKSKFDCFT